MPSPTVPSTTFARRITRSAAARPLPDVAALSAGFPVEGGDVRHEIDLLALRRRHDPLPVPEQGDHPRPRLETVGPDELDGTPLPGKRGGRSVGDARLAPFPRLAGLRALPLHLGLEPLGVERHATLPAHIRR